MSDKRAEFIDVMPGIAIRDGLVHTSGDSGEYVWLPALFRAFCETGLDMLNAPKPPGDVVRLRRQKRD